MASQSDFCTTSNKPLGRVSLVPFHRITVVHGELVVEIMVSLAQRDYGRQEVVSGSQFVVKGRRTKPMRQGVDTEH